MYVPAPFSEECAQELEAIMRACRLPILVSTLRDSGSSRLHATHLPLLIEGDRLIGHVAKANPHWQLIDPAVESLAIFQGVEGYVSPSYYATKRETGKVVPTWNYEAVHAYGRLEIIDDPDQLLDILSRLTDRFEGQRSPSWSVADAPAGYIADQLRGIVGVVLHVSRRLGVRKLSQNKSKADRDGVIAGVAETDPALARQMIRASKGGR